jgi:CHASE3 domain sensor protein
MNRKRITLTFVFGVIIVVLLFMMRYHVITHHEEHAAQTEHEKNISHEKP